MLDSDEDPRYNNYNMLFYIGGIMLRCTKESRTQVVHITLKCNIP